MNIFRTVFESAVRKSNLEIWVPTSHSALYTLTLTLNSNRQKGHCTFEDYIFRNVWLRHVLGFLLRTGSDVVYEVPPETSRLPRGSTELQPRHRSADACHESPEEGFTVSVLFIPHRRLTVVQDVGSAGIAHMSLPLTALPHITTPSLAMSLFTETASRISHSHAIVRKKAVVSLYRLALVYPEALKLAWPKIKDRLMDDQEDSSVITSVVNVVCELGWRRPQDLLPLAPKLFELLVDGGNNWMAIKIIKLVCLPCYPLDILSNLFSSPL